MTRCKDCIVEYILILVYNIHCSFKYVDVQYLPKSPQPAISYHGADEGKEVREHSEHVVDDCGAVVAVAQLVSQVQRQDCWKTTTMLIYSTNLLFIYL